jgi:hypothetical protein
VFWLKDYLKLPLSQWWDLSSMEKESEHQSNSAGFTHTPSVWAEILAPWVFMILSARARKF